MKSLTQLACEWILSAPKAERRTQEQASKLFGIKQSGISLALMRIRAKNAFKQLSEKEQAK